MQKRSCVVIHNTLKFIESFKVISLFSYQGSLFCCRSQRQLVYYILSSLFCQELFFIFETFSFNRFCPICYLKRDNSDILSCVVLFVNNFFVVRCQIMSCPAVSLTMLPSGYYFVNPFFPKISLFYVYFRKVNFTVSVHLSRKDIFPPYFISISHPSHLSLTSHQSGGFPLAQIHCPSWNPG